MTKRWWKNDPNVYYAGVVSKQARADYLPFVLIAIVAIMMKGK